MDEQNQLLIARDIGYIGNDEFKKIAARTVEISRMTNELIKSIKNLNT